MVSRLTGSPGGKSLECGGDIGSFVTDQGEFTLPNTNEIAVADRIYRRVVMFRADGSYSGVFIQEKFLTFRSAPFISKRFPCKIRMERLLKTPPTSA